MSAMQLLEPVLTIDGTARTFVLSGRLPPALAAVERRAEAPPDVTATDIWRGYSIGSDEAMPDHVLIVREASFDGVDRLELRGTIEGPLPREAP